MVDDTKSCMGHLLMWGFLRLAPMNIINNEQQTYNVYVAIKENGKVETNIDRHSGSVTATLTVL